MKCSRCDIVVPRQRIDMGYTICTKCSTEEKVSCHTIYPHKTGGYIQVVSKEQSENLNRLDRRGSSNKTARHYKSIIEKGNKDLDETAKVRRYRISSFDNIVHTPYDEALDKVMSYYEEWGYERTLGYLRQLNSDGDIPLSIRVKLQDTITDRYLQPSSRTLMRKFNKQIA
jgi:hypothetical protein